jgi:hypothetical protein
MTSAPLFPNSNIIRTFLDDRGGDAWLSASHINADGTKGKFETKTFVGGAGAAQWAETQRANLYYSVNPATPNAPRDKKLDREHIAKVVSLHVDLDPRVGETQEAAQERLYKLLNEYKPQPTYIISSGGGMQGIWNIRPEDHIAINGDVAKAENAKLYNLQLERDLGGDNCHDITRVMRLPGTVNIPDDRKLKKGRHPARTGIVERNLENVYPLSAFKKATPAPAAAPSSKAIVSQNAAHIVAAPPIVNLDDDPHTVKLKPWVKRAICYGKDPEGLKVWPKSEGDPDLDRSKMVWAVVCECVRTGVPEGKIRSLLIDPENPFNAQVREKGRAMEREVRRLIKRASDEAIDPLLRELNDEFAVVQLQGKTVIHSTDEEGSPTYQTFEAFKQFQSNRIVTVCAGTKDEKRIPAGEWWLGPWAAEYRTQYKGVRYMPWSDDEVVKGYLNTWHGFAVDPVEGDGHLSYLKHLHDNICAGNTPHFEYLVRWLADRVQNPGRPAGVCVVLKSESEGTGKGFAVKKFGSLFGRAYRQITNADHLTGKFNSHLKELSLLFADEAFYAGDKRHAGVLKTIITEDHLQIEHKGVDMAGSVRNCLGLIMASNMKFVVPAGQNARRFFVLEVATDQLQNEDYFAAIEDDLNAGGLSHLLHFLKTFDLKDFRIRKVPHTKALAEQQSYTRDGIDKLVEHLCHLGRLPFQKPGDCYSVDTSGQRRGEGFWPWADENFPDLKRLDVRKKGGELRSKWGCRPWDSGPRGGYTFPALATLRAKFEKLYGGQEWESPATAWVSTAPGHDGPRAMGGNDDDVPM